jgi:tetratricopeptide (TPR) repeat protein
MKRVKTAKPFGSTFSVESAETACRGQGNFLPLAGDGTAAAPSLANSRRLTVAAAALVVLAAVAAYANSFAGTFAYDDQGAIVENQTIRRLWPLGPVLSPPHSGETVSGRPLLNLSLAINYAISGLDVRSYHAANLLIHVAAALLLMGILRRTFLMPALRDRFGKAAVPLALGSALCWTVHPLQTESVTYIVQRAESLASLFYLLTLYCVIRGAAPVGQAFQPDFCRFGVRLESLTYFAAVLACLLGTACKEILVTAPLIVLLYDRTFLAGSFAAAWRHRWGLYLGLASSWGLLAYLVFSTGLIVRQAEMGAPDIVSYTRSQPGVILHYLRLSVWPSSLCMSYEWPVANTLGEILPGVIVIGLLMAATVWGLIGCKAWGFLGAWFFVILAPTSSMMPLNQLAHEHRMYLSLAAVVVLAVSGGYAFWERWLPPPAAPGRGARVARWGVPVMAWAAVLLALGYGTVARNRDFRSPLAIWQDAVRKLPDSFFAHYNLGTALAAKGRTAEAIEHYHEALSLKADFCATHYNLANALATLGKDDEAIEHYHEALRLKPDYAEAHNNLGIALAAAGRTKEAIDHHRAALRLNPEDATAHNNLGFALAALGKTHEAMEHYHQALRLKPDDAKAHNNLGIALAALGRTDEAIEQYQQALRCRPNYAEGHNNLANALAALGRTEAAIEHYHEALRLKPEYVEAHNNLANALARLGGTNEALEHYREAVRLKPGLAEVHNNLGIALAKADRTEEAIEHCREAVRLKPDFILARYNLANALSGSGRTSEAVEQYRRLLQLRPDSVEILNNLAWLLATHASEEGGDPAPAVELAQRARELSGRENAPCLDTLAAAYAAAGRFSDAVITAERAVQLAEATGQTALAGNIQARLDLYRAGQPYREPPQAPAQRKP